MKVNDITTTQLEQLSLLNPEVDVITIKYYLESIPLVELAKVESLTYLLKISAQSDADMDDHLIKYKSDNISVKPFSLEAYLPAKHHDYHKEEKLMQELLQTERSIGELVQDNFGYVPLIPLARNDVLRSEKNRLIIMSALCCRGAINLGVYPETAFAFSDFFVIRLEDAKTIEEIPVLFTELLTFFRNEIKTAKENDKFSSFTKKIISYIDSHIYQSLDLMTISKNLGFNYKYVSKLFSKETGMTFVDYVNTKKIKLAKDLLKTQNCKIEDIAYYLGFSESYYFSRVFKRYVGITPNEYRKRNIRL
jgi:YesN/AraC family two-component response regulator